MISIENQHKIDLPIYTLPFIVEADYSMTVGGMIHCDRTADFNVAIYLLKGRMEIIEDGRQHILTPNTLFFLKSGVHHWGERPFEAGTAWYYSHFYCESPDNLAAEFVLPMGDSVQKRYLSPTDRNLFLRLPKSAVQPSAKERFEALIKAHAAGNSPLASVYLMQIFLELVAPRPTERSAISAVKAYIAEHYNEDISSLDIAKLTELSPKYFGELFRQATGVTLKRYQLHMRIDKACRLLHETDLAVYQIAEQLGFCDSFYFSRIFTKEMGCSPSKYRSDYIPRI